MNDDEQERVAGGGTWTPAMLARLHAATVDNVGARALLDLTAATPGTTVTLEQVRVRSGLDSRAQTSAHYVLTRTLIELFGTGLWPVERLWAARYRMPRQVAGWWRALEQPAAARAAPVVDRAAVLIVPGALSGGR